MDEQRQDNSLEPTYDISVLIQDVALTTNQEQWTIEKGGGRSLGRSARALRDNDVHRLVSLC